MKKIVIINYVGGLVMMTLVIEMIKDGVTKMLVVKKVHGGRLVKSVYVGPQAMNMNVL